MFSDTGRHSWFAHRLCSARMMVANGLGPGSLCIGRSVWHGAVAAAILMCRGRGFAVTASVVDGIEVDDVDRYEWRIRPRAEHPSRCW